MRSSARTLGEFDLIVRNENFIEHWEIAVKFFLGIGDRKNIGHWIGPNPRDTLERKLDSLENRQIRLGDNPDAKRILEQKDIKIDSRRIIFKGRLFHPYKMFKTSRFVGRSAFLEWTSLASLQVVPPPREIGQWLDLCLFSLLMLFNRLEDVLSPYDDLSFLMYTDSEVTHSSDCSDCPNFLSPPGCPTDCQIGEEETGGSCHGALWVR